MIFTIPPFQPVIDTPIAIVQKVEEKKPEPKLYTIQPNDTLESIATANLTTVQRLFNKNTSIDNPDLIKPGEVLTIPLDDEVLSERVIVEKPVFVASKPQPRGFSSSGNLYARGFCTWYAKSRRPDLPNSLGNADTWLIRAQKLGLPTSGTPSVGAVAVAYRTHVAIVEQVNGNQILISDMNYRQLGVVTTRWVSTSVFQGYIL